MKKSPRRFSDDERAFLKSIVFGRSHVDIMGLFNSRFDNPITVAQVGGFIKYHKLSTGRTGFEKGHVPHNKGKPRHAGWKKSSTVFKKGNVPPKHRPVGSTRVTPDGYIEIKTEEPKKWELLHHVAWKRENGTIPDGCVLIFADGNSQNVSVDNLIPVTRAQLAIINKFGLNGKSKEITETGIVVADIIAKIGRRKNSGTLIRKGADNAVS